jgi:hypothetical protein
MDAASQQRPDSQRQARLELRVKARAHWQTQLTVHAHYRTLALLDTAHVLDRNHHRTMHLDELRRIELLEHRPQCLAMQVPAPGRDQF